MRISFSGLFALVMVLLVSGSATAQSDPFGEIDLVYGDSVLARPGQEIVVRFSLTNDEALGSISVPLTFDTTVLTLQSIDFENSRVDFIGTKIVDPVEVANANGRFVVAVIRFFEEAISPGDGPIFNCRFVVSSDAAPGTMTIIDSTFIPPGNELLLGEANSAIGIHPAFISGKITILGQNRAPSFTRTGDRTIFEGDSLILDLRADDPDNDSLTLSATTKPMGATFVDNGDGSAQFVWIPGFVGQNSSDGSPYILTFRATDGSLSADETITVSVINRNRPPIILAPTTVPVMAGEAFEFSLTAHDPDFEDISWSTFDHPDNAAFAPGNPSIFGWSPPLVANGTRTVGFIVTDPAGFADTAMVTLSISPAVIYTLSLDTVEAFSSEEFSYDISLNNRAPVAGFDVVFHFDPTGMSFVSGTNVGSRSELFEQFDVTTNVYGVPGNVRVRGLMKTDMTASLSSGTGTIARFTFRTAVDLSLAGQNVPVIFLTSGSPLDNTLTDTAGVTIPRQDIATINGRLQILSLGDVQPGDINLNGLVAEIADVILFTNYFIDPSAFPFNPLQFANSDVNRDNLAATIADLISLIRIVVEGPGSGPKMLGDDFGSASAEMEIKDGRVTLVTYSPVDIGGAFFKLSLPEEIRAEDIIVTVDEMTYDFSVSNGNLRFVLYSWDGRSLPSGKREILSVATAGGVSVTEVELSSIDGRQISLSAAQVDSPIPGDYRLAQNYPNPFNPSTVIEFLLPTASTVRLSVYNLLGQTVTTLADGQFPAGRHVVEWDGHGPDGQTAASGVYFYRLDYGNEAITRKMLLMK